MTASDSEATPDQADAPGSSAEAAPSPTPDDNDVSVTSEAEASQDHDKSSEDNQTTQIINNFYAEVAANTVGMSGGATQVARPAVRRESGVLAGARVSEALRYYLRPAPFDQALKIFTDRHFIALTGPEGCGKKAGTLELARIACPDAESYTVLPPTRSLAELASYKGYRSGQPYLMHDWVPVSTDLRSVAAYDLEQLTARLTTVGAYMAITFENFDHLQALLTEVCVPWSAPEPTALLEHCAEELSDLQLSDSEYDQLRSCATEVRSPRLIIKLAESAIKSVTAALDEAGETKNSAVAEWFGSNPERWKVWSVAALTFLSGVRERKFERLVTALSEIKRTHSPDDERGEEPKDDEAFPQTRWRLANDPNLGTFISGRDPSAPVGAEYRPAFRTKAYRLHFMIELNTRFGDDLWTSVRDWLFALADQPFGEAQIAAGYGLALLARCALQEVEATYLTPWSAGNLRERLMVVNVLWSMAEDDLSAPAALRIAVSWVRNRGQERAITAALAFGGPLGERYPSEAMRWLWVLAQRSDRIRRVASTAISQLFAIEAEADLEKSAVIRFVLQKVRPMLGPDVAARERRASLAVVNSVLSTTQALSDMPTVVSIARTRPADFQPLGELWAAALNSVPHRRDAITALHSTLVALVGGADSEELAARLGNNILPRLTARTLQVLELALPDPGQAGVISASVVAAFLGARKRTIERS